MEELNPSRLHRFLYDGVPQIYENQIVLGAGERCFIGDCINEFERRTLLDIAENEEREGRFVNAGIAYKYADRFGDYLRCMDKAIREAEEKGDYAMATLLAEQVASKDVVETYRRLERLNRLTKMKE